MSNASHNDEPGAPDRGEKPVVAHSVSNDRVSDLFHAMSLGYSFCEMIRGDADGTLDYRILEINLAYEKLTGLSRADAVGRRVTEAVPGIGQEWIKTFDDIVRSGQPRTFDEHTEALGRWYSIHAHPTEGGRFHVLYEDITDRKRTEEALRESEERQAFLLKLSDALRPLADPIEVQAMAAHLIGKHFGVDRSNYYEVETDGWMTRTHGYASGEVIQPERLQLNDWGQLWADSYLAGRTDFVSDIATDDRWSDAERETWLAVPLRAALGVPLLKGGRLRAILGLNNAEPHHWTASEVALAKEVAERTWAAVERARAEAALAESEERHRGVFETMTEGFALIELVRDSAGAAIDYRHLELNPAIEAQTGITRDLLIGRLHSEAFPDTPEDISRYWISILATAVDTQSVQTFENYLPGVDRWMVGSATPVGGQRLYVVYQDATERKRATDALRDSEERQAFLLKLSDALQSLVDPMEIQGAASRLLGQQLGLDRCGYAEIDFAGEFTTVHQDYHVPDVAAFVGSYRLDDFGADFIDTLRRGETLVIDDVTKDQAHANPLVAASHADSETVAMIAAPLVKGIRFVAVLFAHSRTARHWTPAEVALIEEVAERTWAAVEWARAEAALRESEERFRQFSDASPNVLWIRDADTLEMQFASPAFEKIYGIPGPDSGDGRLRNWVRLIEPEHRKSVLGNFRRVRAGERVEHEFQIRRATDWALRWIHNTDFPLRDASGAVRWLAGIGVDISDLKEVNDLQDVLVNELQHRTRNLIAVVQFLSNRTLRDATSLEDFENRFRLRLSALARVQELLSFREPGEKVTFKELLCAELDALGVSNGLASKLTLDGPADVPLRSTTVQTFALALHELATNASKYGAFAFPNGHLAVSWRVEPASGDDLPHLHVEWRESGVVMPEISAPAKGGGYGRQLIERALPYQLNAKTTFEMGSDGVRCTIEVPLGGGEIKGEILSHK